jgi:hypothetical protein
MNSLETKMAKLVMALERKSTDGLVPWDPIPMKDVFRARIADYYVDIAMVSGPYEDDDYVLRIGSSKGHLVCEATDSGLRDFLPGQAFKTLFQEARRTAYKTSGVIDEIIEKLNEMGG